MSRTIEDRLEAIEQKLDTIISGDVKAPTISGAPIWATHVARDKGGEWNYFDAEPISDIEQWVVGPESPGAMWEQVPNPPLTKNIWLDTLAKVNCNAE